MSFYALALGTATATVKKNYCAWHLQRLYTRAKHLLKASKKSLNTIPVTLLTF